MSWRVDPNELFESARDNDRELFDALLRAFVFQQNYDSDVEPEWELIDDRN